MRGASEEVVYSLALTVSQISHLGWPKSPSNTTWQCVFPLGSSVYLKKPWTLGLPRAAPDIFSSAVLKLFSICSSHSVCAVTLRKDQNIQQEQRKVKESHCCSYTTSSSVTPPPLLSSSPQTHTHTYVCLPRRSQGENTTGETGDRSLAPGGKNHEKQSSGRMFVPRPIGKQGSCFQLLSDILVNVFFHNLAEFSLFWRFYFLFLPSKV